MKYVRIFILNNFLYLYIYSEIFDIVNLYKNEIFNFKFNNIYE